MICPSPGHSHAQEMDRSLQDLQVFSLQEVARELDPDPEESEIELPWDL